MHSSPGSGSKPLSKVAVTGYQGLYLCFQPNFDNVKLDLGPGLLGKQQWLRYKPPSPLNQLLFSEIPLPFLCSRKWFRASNRHPLRDLGKTVLSLDFPKTQDDFLVCL